MASDIWLRTILIVRTETRCRHIGYSFRLAARVLLYAPPHRQHSTYHGLCYTSRGALTGTRNSSMGPPHEGSIRRPIAPWANALTTELHLATSVEKSLSYIVCIIWWTCSRVLSLLYILTILCFRSRKIHTGADGAVAMSSAKKWTGRYWVRISVPAQTQSGVLKASNIVTTNY